MTASVALSFPYAERQSNQQFVPLSQALGLAKPKWNCPRHDLKTFYKF